MATTQSEKRAATSRGAANDTNSTVPKLPPVKDPYALRAMALRQGTVKDTRPPEYK